MIVRTAKTFLVFGIILYYTIAILNNLIDYDLNYQYIKHVLTMDTIFADSHSMWRALRSPIWHQLFYVTIIIWEIADLMLCAWGGVRMVMTLRANVVEFNQAKNNVVAALSLSLLMWLVAFFCVGGEWFLMWQSNSWNGQEAALQMFNIVGLIMLIVMQPENPIATKNRQSYNHEDFE